MLPKYALKNNVATPLWWLAFGTGILTLGIHFTLIQLSNMPVNPLSLRLAGPIQSYVHPLFSQNWSFFAPQPIDRDELLVVQGAYLVNGEKRQTGWIDISTPLVNVIKHNRLSPVQLVQLMLSNAVVSFNNSIGSNKQATYLKNGVRYVKASVPSNLDPVNVTVLQRTGAAVLEGMYPQVTFTQIHLGIMTSQFPRFSQRNDPKAQSKLSFTAVDWMPMPKVTPFCCVALQGGLHE